MKIREVQDKSGFQHRLEYQEQMINNKVTEHCNTNENNSNCNYRLGGNDNNINSKRTKHRKRKII